MTLEELKAEAKKHGYKLTKDFDGKEFLSEQFLNDVGRHGIYIRENCIGKAVYYLGVPLPRTVNKSDEYMEAYIEGFLRYMLMSDFTRKELK